MYVFIFVVVVALAANYLATAEDVWEDTEETSFMWHAISERNTEALMNILDEDETSAFRRSFIVS